MDLDENTLDRARRAHVPVDGRHERSRHVPALAALAGWRWGLGYTLGGALASWLNFRWLRKLVDSLGQAASGKPPRPASPCSWDCATSCWPQAAMLY